MKKNGKVLASLLALSMVACSSSAIFAEEATTGAAETGTTPLVVGYSAFSQKFSPFYADTAYDQDAVGMTQVGLMTTDRMGGIIYNAIEGETVSYNGTDYTYTGIADLSVKYDEASDTTVYTAKLRDDIYFSDGVQMTADDIIFNYYVYLDNSYVGSTTLGSYDIVGLQNYRYNSTAAEGVSISADDVAAAIAEPDADTTAYMENLVSSILTEEQAWCADVYADYNAPSDWEFFIQCYSLDPEYDGTDKDYDTIVADVIAQYGADYKALAANYAGDETYFDGNVIDYVQDKLEADAVAAAGGEEVPNITGIQKLDEYTVSVTTNGYEAPAVYSILGISIAPMHYYGDPELYDYENNMFGFERNNYNLDAEKATHPLGAGPYEFIEYSNKTVYYEANEDYYKGAPKIQEVQFKEVVAAEMAAGVQTGTVDCGELTGSKKAFEEVADYNSNKEITGDVITTMRVDNLGYGYIGINASNVNVAGEPDSDASKNLRKGLATILSVYRDTSVDSYYGEAASVINYPISNTSWAAPQVTDEGYKLAFSVDVNGNSIYTSDMTADDKYAAAKTAALGFFEAAGYTVEDGKVTAAPEGAKLEYEVIIPAEGMGDHPSFAVLTDAEAAFAEIGITLKINDPADSNILWDSMDGNTHELWCAAWGATIDPDMYQVYHSSNIVGEGGSDSNHYHITDATLDNYILEARTSDDQAFRKEVYKTALDVLMDWAVEIPVYQRQNCTVFSSERVNVETVTPDITTFYGWMSEIENMEMN